METVPERFNLSSILDWNLEAGRAHKVAVFSWEEELTYGELARRANRLGHALRHLGIRREERILLVLDDTPAFPVAFYGAIRVAAVPIPVSTFFTSGEYRFFLEDSYARAVIVDRVHYEKVNEAVSQVAEPVLVIVANGRVEGAYALEDLLATGPDHLDPAVTHRDDPLCWQYSSGSTGRPKAVVHLHQNAYYGCRATRNMLRLTAEDRTFAASKLFHSFATAVNMLVPHLGGASCVYLSARPTPAALFDTIERFRPTLFFAAPTLYYQMLQEPGCHERDVSSVRLFVAGGEALPLEVWRRWKAVFGGFIMDETGSTEMFTTYLANAPEDYKPGASGKSVAGHELKLLDSTGAPVGPGGSGELYVKAKSGFAFYWHNHQKTRETIRGEWYRTGDRYRLDEDGFFWYEGRADDMMKVGGLWVSPIEIENALMEHPEVGEAAVVGVRVDDTITRIKAYVTLRRPGKPRPDLVQELQAWCKQRLLRHQYPHIVEFVEELPRTDTGKTRRAQLRAPAGSGSLRN